ncbi:MAG TPA: hypothetical protein QF624_09240 [Dehalococcoidia bacterium]|nr:hypothetical protein [Dehalococcoidia bacterium]
MTTEADTSAYAAQRASDWEQFAARSDALIDYWAEWETRSHGWRVPIEFLQPLGLDKPKFVEPLQPLIKALDALDEVDVIPTSWLHLTTVHVGFLMATGIMWSQVESFYVNAAPRLHRIEPFDLVTGGVSVTEDGVYLGVDDGLVLRELRRQLKLGVPAVYEVMKDDPLITADGDAYVPQIPLAYFTGEGERARVVEALEPFREIEGDTVAITQAKMARLPIQPHDHYFEIDVVAEIALLGEAARQGYHN